MRRRMLIGTGLLLAVAAVGLLRWRPPDVAAPAALSTAQPQAAAAPAAQAAVAMQGPPAPPPRSVVSASGVPIRLIRSRRLVVPEPPYGPAYARLAPLARQGDSTAQYLLGLLEYECRDVPGDAAALERDIENTYATRRRAGWDVSDAADEEQTLRRRFAECDGVPPEERGRYRDWLAAAANAGLLEAQLDLPLHLPAGEYCQFIEDCTPEQRDKQQALEKEAVDYLGRARDGGSAMALWTFGAWYAEGDVLPQDNVQAYAYFSALAQVFAAAGEARRFDAILADLGSRLRPADLAQAQAQMRQILSNPNCCVLGPD
ncbi:MAG: hypothetical protein ISP90_00580 [Nevskia sp.]|nr:hypothetical protein [Nevskia sp.]